MRALLLVALVLLAVSVSGDKNKKETVAKKGWRGGIHRLYVIIHVQKRIINYLKQELASTRALLNETQANLTMAMEELEQCTTELEECEAGPADECPDIQQLLVDNGHTFTVTLSTPDTAEGTMVTVTYASGCVNTMSYDFTCTNVNGELLWTGNGVSTEASFLNFIVTECSNPFG